jgi:hypothetical protein
MKSIILLLVILALLWAKYTKREELYSKFQTAALVVALIFILERLFPNL